MVAVSARAMLADSFVYRNGVFNTLHVPGASARSVQVSGINDSGQIVGSFSNSTGLHGFLDTAGVITSIDVPGSANTLATGINDAGQIVGASCPGNFCGSFLDTNGVFSSVTDFPSNPTGINNKGQIAGWEIDILQGIAGSKVSWSSTGSSGSLMFLEGTNLNVRLPLPMASTIPARLQALTC